MIVNKDRKKSTSKENNFVDHVISVKRVTKVTKGGKRFSFAACVVSGDKKGNIGLGLGKSREVSLAITKATNKARKKMINVCLRASTIPYGVHGKHGAARVIIHPASKGTGNIAGGAVRAVLDSVGVEDILTKSLGSTKCQQNVAKATLNALSKLRSASYLAKLRGKTIQEMVKGV